jgi:hypothetical protein
MLERILARSDQWDEPPGYAQALFATFGRPLPPDAEIPTAAVSWLGETGEAASGCWMHADPLHLVPDRDSLLAFDLADAPLDANEIGQLLEAFNSHFREDGIALASSPGGRLLLRCSETPSIVTQPLTSVLGRHLDRFLPTGDHSRFWQGLMNETQMLCHALPFNPLREAHGRPTLGGLWFSGAGCLPGTSASAVGQVEADCLLARGLIRLAAPRGEDEVVVDHAMAGSVERADADAWLRSVERLESRMPDLLQGCEAFHLHPCDGTVWRWRKGSAWRFWRRQRPLVEWVANR